MKKRMTIMIIALIIVFGGLIAFNIIKDKFMAKLFASFPMPPATISATTAKAMTWQPYLTGVGNLVATNGVQVTSEAAGIIEKIYYQSGQIVTKGEPLIKLDDRVDVQELNNLLAQLKLDQLNYQREATLYKTKATPKSTLDAAKAKLQQTQALVAKMQVLIDQKTIKAPFTGKIGIAPLNIGQYIQAGTQLVSLQSLNPMWVRFNLPEQDLALLEVGQKIIVEVDAYKGEQFTGKIDAINSEVTQQTRNILVQASIPNPDNKLYPGMFADVKVFLPQQHNVVVVPQTAVTYSLYGDTIYVIKKEPYDKAAAEHAKKFKVPYSNLKAFRQNVTVGERRGNQVVILKGLKAGEEIVTSGQLKLQEATPVLIDKNIDMSDTRSDETLH